LRYLVRNHEQNYPDTLTFKTLLFEMAFAACEQDLFLPFSHMLMGNYRGMT